MISNNTHGGGLANLKSRIPQANWEQVEYLHKLLMMLEIKAATGRTFKRKTAGAGTAYWTQAGLVQQLNLRLVLKTLELAEFLQHVHRLIGFIPTALEVDDLKAALELVPKATIKVRLLVMLEKSHLTRSIGVDSPGCMVVHMYRVDISQNAPVWQLESVHWPQCFTLSTDLPTRRIVVASLPWSNQAAPNSRLSSSQ
jgi:hypothetical protein